MKMAVLWIAELCSLVEVYWRFRGICCLHHQADEEAASTSEVSVNFYQTTWCYNPEDSHLHTRRCENLKSYLM
jgi:7-cyano-7-deazaguanine synthase in queuosine biosynthesis